MNGVEIFIDTSTMHPFDLLGVLVAETKLCGVINNYPLRRSAVPYDSIDLYASNKRRIRIYIRNPDMSVVNLTGAVAVFTVKHTKTGAVVFQKSTATPAQGAIGDAAGGEAFFYIVQADTTTLDIAQYVFDVKVTLSGSDGPYTVTEGVINLLKPVG